MKKDWLPKGAGRAVATRMIGLGGPLNFILATSLTPYLADKFGARPLALPSIARPAVQ